MHPWVLLELTLNFNVTQLEETSMNKKRIFSWDVGHREAQGAEISMRAQVSWNFLSDQQGKTVYADFLAIFDERKGLS